jgi:ElaB/YqjD/DUF883 family membrane-anchored ribosome-binding protein
MADPKNDQNNPASKDNPASKENKGSGSDTVSAAKISAGTSVGTVGQSPPMPQAQGGAGNPAQSSTLASHTSTPLGGQSAGKDQQSGAGAAQGGQSRGRDQQQGSSQAGQGQGGQGQSKGAADTMKQGAEQARERADEAYDDAKEWMRETYESASSWASDAMGGSNRPGPSRRRSMGNIGSTRRNVQEYVAQNPVMVGLVGLAAGLLLGALLPRTRRENEMFGEWADEVREQGMRYAHDMTQRGREFVEESFSGDDPRFSKHESEFGPGPGADRSAPGANRH